MTSSCKILWRLYGSPSHKHRPDACMQARRHCTRTGGLHQCYREDMELLYWCYVIYRFIEDIIMMWRPPWKEESGNLDCCQLNVPFLNCNVRCQRQATAAAMAPGVSIMISAARERHAISTTDTLWVHFVTPCTQYNALITSWYHGLYNADTIWSVYCSRGHCRWKQTCWWLSSYLNNHT